MSQHPSDPSRASDPAMHILSDLLASAAQDGYAPVRFACTPATGEEGDEISGTLTLDACVAHADAWDSDSVVEFRNGDSYFWVLLVWGNGEDVVSDYLATPDADRIVGRVYDSLEAR